MTTCASSCKQGVWHVCQLACAFPKVNSYVDTSSLVRIGLQVALTFSFIRIYLVLWLPRTACLQLVVMNYEISLCLKGVATYFGERQTLASTVINMSVLA